MLDKSNYEINLCGTDEPEIVKVERAYYTVSSELMFLLRMHKSRINLNFKDLGHKQSYNEGSLEFSAPLVYLQQCSKDVCDKESAALISSIHDYGLTYAFLMMKVITGKSFYLPLNSHLLLGNKNPYSHYILLKQFSFRDWKLQEISSIATEGIDGLKAKVNPEAVAILRADINELKAIIKNVFDAHPKELDVMRQSDSEHREAICHKRYNDPFEVGNHEMKALTCFNIFVLAEQEIFKG